MSDDSTYSALPAERDAAVRLLLEGLTSFERLHELIESLPVGILLVDTTGRLVDSNSRALQILGPDDSGAVNMYADHPAWWAQTGEPIRPDERPLRRALRGETSTGSIIEVRRPDGTRVTVLASAAPLNDLDGMPAGAIVILQDITEDYRRIRHSDALNTVNDLLQSQRPLGTVMKLALSATAQATDAESAVVYVRQDDEWVSRWVYGLPASFVGLRFRDEELRPVFESSYGERDAGFGRGVPGPRLQRRGIRTVADAPLPVDKEFLALFAVYHHDPREFDELDADFLRKVAATLTLALRTSARSERQLHIGRRIQQALQVVPTELPGLQIAHLYRSATRAALIGGDFYDVFLAQDGVAGLIIGDISGKGIEAAAATVTARSLIRSAAYDGLDPSGSLRRLQQLHLRDMPEHFFVTVFFAMLDLTTGRLVYSSAGHPPPLVRRVTMDGTEVLALPPTAPLLGGLRLGPPPQAAAQLHEGDVVLLYTDGVIETRNERRELYGEARLRKQLARPGSLSSLPRRILADVRRFSAGRISDDIALMAVSWREPGA